MIFSAIIGAGASLLGASSANKASKRASADNRAAIASQERIQTQQMNLARDEMRDRRAELDYQRGIEALNRELAAQDYDFNVEELRRLQDQLLSERQHVLDRQVELDRDAAQQRAFQIEQLLQNQSISAAERERALQELEEAQAVAAGERDEDLRRLAEEREMKAIERDYMIDVFGQARQQAQSERDYDLAFRDNLTGRIDDLQSALDQTLSFLGPAPAIASLSPQDIEREILMREDQYMGDADRAIDRVASVNEARLISNGMDESTQANRRRRDIASQAASMYEQARTRARDEALNYISGRQGALVDNANAIMGNRSARLNETGQVAGAGLDRMMQMPNVGSAMGAFSLASAVPSAVHTRNLRSANDYSAPLQVGSSIYDRTQIGTGMGATLNPQSAATGAGLNLRRTLISPYGNPNFNPGAALSAAGATGAGIVSATNSNLASANANAMQAGQALGSSLQNLGESFANSGVGRKVSARVGDFFGVGGGGTASKKG